MDRDFSYEMLRDTFMLTPWFTDKLAGFPYRAVGRKARRPQRPSSQFVRHNHELLWLYDYNLWVMLAYVHQNRV